MAVVSLEALTFGINMSKYTADHCVPHSLGIVSAKGGAEHVNSKIQNFDIPHSIGVDGAYVGIECENSMNVKFRIPPLKLNAGFSMVELV